MHNAFDLASHKNSDREEVFASENDYKHLLLWPSAA